MLSQRARWIEGEPIASRLMAQAMAHPGMVSLAAGFVDHQTLPVEPVRRAWEAVWADPQHARAALQYGTTVGYPPLRQALLDRLLAADHRTAAELNLSVERVVLTAGSNQLLFLLGDVLLDPGDIVLCAAPSYYVFLGILENLGACAVGVEIDQDGLIPAALDDELQHLDAAGELARVKAVYLTTYYDNPCGLTLPAERRAAVVEIAKRWSQRAGRTIYVIEDAAYRELRYTGDDVPSLRASDPEGDTVIHVGSFSKSFSPGVRMGWGMLPPALVEPVMRAKGNVDFGSPHLNQVLMAAVLEMGLFDPHVAQLRAHYRAKLDVLLAAAERVLQPLGVEWVCPSGGLYLWLRLPEGIDAGFGGPLFRRAAAEGVLYVPGAPCFPRGDVTARGQALAGRQWHPPKNTLRVSFGMPAAEDIERGIEALGRAVGEVLP